MEWSDTVTNQTELIASADTFINYRLIQDRYNALTEVHILQFQLVFVTLIALCGWIPLCCLCCRIRKVNSPAPGSKGPRPRDIEANYEQTVPLRSRHS